MLYVHFMGIINGKAGMAAALPRFSDTLTLSQPEGADYAHPLALPHLTKFCDLVKYLISAIFGDVWPIFGYCAF